MSERRVFGRLVAAAFLVAVGTAAADPAAIPVAKAILDDSKTQAEREALVKANPKLSADLIAVMTSDLTPGTKEEYRRIPWIWRVAIAAGKRNDVVEMKRILEVALPERDKPLDDWRVVVIGGGLINGITQAGDWPDRQFAKMFPGADPPIGRWLRTLELAAAMADNPKVATGTRYDALRLLGVEPWDRCAGALLRYQVKGTEPELQMGAVSALGDVRDGGAAVAQVLISGLPNYDKTNRELALDALVRDEPRALALLDAVADGRVKADVIGPKRVEGLKAFGAESVRRKAAEVLK